MKSQVPVSDSVKETTTALIKFAKTAKSESEILAYVSQRLAGEGKRFVRQDVTQLLSGNRLPMSQCGVGAIAKRLFNMNRERILGSATACNN